MTSPDLRTLLDDATREVPVATRQPPLSAIHGRVRRRRTRLTVLAAGVAVLMGGALVPTYTQLTRPPAAPAASTEPAKGIVWQFAQVDGLTMKIYTSELGPCTVLDDPRTRLDRTAGSVSITLTGTPRRADDCGSAGVPLAQITLDRPIGDEVLRDGATGHERPLYDRADLPTGVGNGWVGFGWGAQIDNHSAPEFHARYYRLDQHDLEVRGKGLVSVDDDGKSPQPGESMTFGSTEGLLLETAGSFRFQWDGGHVSGLPFRVRYEITVPYGTVSRTELLSRLNRLIWP